MKETWFSEIEPRVFTIFKKRMGESFSGVFFTTANEEVSERKFPCVYLHEMEQIEQGNDLINETVNAVLSTFQIQVFSKDAAQNKSIMTEAVRQMKRLRFEVTAMPIYTSEGDKTVFLSVARFRRVIGSGDVDLVKV